MKIIFVPILIENFFDTFLRILKKILKIKIENRSKTILLVEYFSQFFCVKGVKII